MNLLHLRRSQSSQENSQRLAPAADVSVSTHEDGIVLLHIPSGRIFQSNRTGARIWSALSDGLDLDAISQRLSRDFNVPAEMVRRDATKFLEQLEQLGFVAKLRSFAI